MTGSAGAVDPTGPARTPELIDESVAPVRHGLLSLARGAALQHVKLNNATVLTEEQVLISDCDFADCTFRGAPTIIATYFERCDLQGLEAHRASVRLSCFVDTIPPVTGVRQAENIVLNDGEASE